MQHYVQHVNDDSSSGECHVVKQEATTYPSCLLKNWALSGTPLHFVSEETHVYWSVYTHSPCWGE